MNFRFQAVWDDRENEYGDLMKYEILYFLSDDTVTVKEIHLNNDGRDPYPILLRKTKLPKVIAYAATKSSLLNILLDNWPFAYERTSKLS